jgi:non-reducing end alpha-L-arabinofuranosidase
MKSSWNLISPLENKYRRIFPAIVLLVVAALIATPSVHAQGPCDVLSDNGSPCAAAYSTIRLLSQYYSTALYQVTNAANNETLDIYAGDGGFADSAAQDSFCVNATCTITEIYDQTGNGVNLTLATSNSGSYQQGSGPDGTDLPSLATASPLIADGHRVYGVYIAPGNGYRNDTNPSNSIPTGSSPQGVYMVANSLTEVYHNTAAECCFDFGNAETDDDNGGPGTMDAISLMCDIVGQEQSCQPTVQADLEDGAYAQIQNSSSSQFVMAAVSNGGVATGNLQTWWGDAAQSGSLSTNGPVSLSSLSPEFGGNGQPDQYAPMHQEGAVLLGIGGDNSIRAAGEFYEGVVTQGAPSQTVWAQILSNAQGSGYQSTPTPVVDGQIYTFTNEASGMLLGNDGSVSSGAPVVEEESTDSAVNVEWTAHAQGNGWFTLTNVQTSGENALCLDSPWGNPQPSFVWPPSQYQSSQTPGSTDLWQHTCNGAQPQNWKFIEQADGTYVIENQSSTIGNGNQMVIDDWYGEAQPGQNLWLNTPNGLYPQNWTVTQVQ